jgi:hypothetical protein
MYELIIIWILASLSLGTVLASAVCTWLEFLEWRRGQ